MRERLFGSSRSRCLAVPSLLCGKRNGRTGTPCCGSHRIVGRAFGVSAVLTSVLVLCAGCPDGNRQIGVPPRDGFEALERINQNLARFSEAPEQPPRPLYCPAKVSFRFRDANGTRRSFIYHDALLIFQPPRCLRFDVKSLTGVIAEVGSDQERYWVWVEPDARKLWWGYWHNLTGARGRLPIPPAELLDALMLRPLPLYSEHALSPLLRIDGDDHRILIVRTDGGRATGWREIRLQPQPPYQALAIVDRLADGRALIVAELSDYQPVGPDGPWIPRRYVVRWPLDEAELRLDIVRARFRPGLEGFCEFPSQWQGEIEQRPAVRFVSRRGWRGYGRRALVGAALAAVALWPPLAAAQFPPTSRDAGGGWASRPYEGNWQVRVAASERMLWLAVVGPQRTQIFHRTATGHFDLGQTVAGRVDSMAALEDEVLLLMEDNSLYRFGRGRTLREVGLPQRERALDLTPTAQGLFALAPTRAAAGLPRLEERPEEADTAPSAGDAFPEQPGSEGGLSVVHYDGVTWRLVANCPREIRAAGASRTRPRLVPGEQDLLLVAILDDRPGEIAQYLHRRDSGQWIRFEPFPAPGAAGFWTASVNRAAALIVALREGESERIELYRNLGQADAAAPSWQRAQTRLAALAGHESVRTYHDAFGFNQAVGLLAEDNRGQMHLQFVGIGGPPTEPSLAVREVLARPGLHLRVQGLIQAATLFLLVVMMVVFLVFRRTSVMRPAQLPARCELALVSQRAAATVIDLSIFALPAALLLGVNWRDGLWRLGAWGIGGGPASELPDAKLLLWWGITAGGFALYSLVMELTVRRSLGKMLTGVHLLSDTGTPPAAWQILLRNLTRFVELLPQFWVLALLMVISRNRQRLGDVFARTVAVRYVAPGAGGLRGEEHASKDDRSDE
jgi:uncharacterized RDD family membrane protein YckC